MTPAMREALLIGAGTAAAAFVVLLTWRTLRRARRAAKDRAKIERERQPELRAALARRLSLREDELPELGGWKITPDFACLLADLVTEGKPRHVLELGAGSSTVLLALALRGTGATLTSLEQDEAHAGATRRMLRERGLESGVHVEHAPVVRWPGSREDEPAWYAPEALARLGEVFGPPWDLVIVDGPSTLARADARLPALPRLAKHLAPRVTVVLDDAARPGERAVVAAWKGMGLLAGFTVQEVPLARGAVVMRRSGA